MRRNQPPSENVVDQRFEQAKPTGSRVRRMIHHDKRWLQELGLIPYEIPQMAPLNTWIDPSGAPIPAQRRMNLTPEMENMPRVPHDYESPFGQAEQPNKTNVAQVSDDLYMKMENILVEYARGNLSASQVQQQFKGLGYKPNLRPKYGNDVEVTPINSGPVFRVII